ncbi:MAG: hypothetical protein M3066_06200 [Actinomycetota bacterium]|nr:hypothetical protein [Actinomycetota bacterium]
MADHPDPVTGSIGVGDATATTPNPDAGKRVEFQGSLAFAPTLGAADYQGAFSLPGFIRSGHATGDMVISADRGSVSLHLVSGELPGFAPADGTYSFTWTVTDATGDFQGLQAQGTVDITLVPLYAPDDGPRVQHLFQIVQFGDPASAAIPGADTGSLAGSTTAG